jgi:methylmalonyl-CoA/ethylmalonyl-CoA epimerase
MFKILGVDHIGIAVPDLAGASKFWSESLGLEHTKDETVADQKVTTGFFPTANGAEFELLEATADDSPIAKYIGKNNGRAGIQHVALRVDDLAAALADLKAKGVRLIDEKPRKGAGGAMIAFIHPKSSGILLELCQHD